MSSNMQIAGKVVSLDVVVHIFNFCRDAVTIHNIECVSKDFKKIVENIHEMRMKCYGALHVANRLDWSIREISQGKECIIVQEGEKFSILEDPIMGELEECHPSIKRFSQKELEGYSEAIAKSSKDKLQVIFLEFKENLIDALCHRNCLDKIELPKLPAKVMQGEMSLVNILEKANKREKGDVFINFFGEMANPNFALKITGTISKDDQLGRQWGDYGTNGGQIPSLNICITNNKAEDWRDSVPEKLPFGMKGIDSYLPAELFLGKKEEDRVTFSFKDKEVVLICRSKPYPITRDVDFQTQIITACNLAKNLSPFYFTPPLSFDEQNQKIQEFKKKYLASIEDVNSYEDSSPFPPTLEL